MSSNPLLDPWVLNQKIALKNRIVMAPMTRCKALRDLVPNPLMADYYAKRAKAGLIISEATIICPNAQGYPNTPGIFTPAHIEGWKVITDAIHQAGGTCFLQLWHVGRASHPMYLNGDLPVAPSPIKINGRLPYTSLPYETPRALSASEVSYYVEQFARCAKNAINAGFDGVEIHAANGYLLDQFLHYNSNQRQDIYGGSPENLSRFALEVVDAVSESIGSYRTGIRLSPTPHVLDIQEDSKDKAVFIYLLETLSKKALAYVHTAIDNDQLYRNGLEATVSQFVRTHYQGTLIANGGYTSELALEGIQNQQFDLVSFAKLFLANPDLVDRIEQESAPSAYDIELLKALN